MGPPYPNNFPSQQNQNQPPAQPPPPAADPPAAKTTTASTVVPASKPISATSGPLATNGQTNSNTNSTQSTTSRPTTGGGPMRGRGGISRGGRAGYNSNISVTGGDMQQQQQDQNKPYFRPSTRGRGGGFVQGPTRQGPIPVASHHQPPSGMQVSGGQMPLKRGPPIAPPVPKRGRYDQAPPHRVHNPSSHMPPNHHSSAPPQSYYHNAAPPPVQHQSNR